MTKASNWIGLYGVQKFGPPVINAFLKASKLDRTFGLFKEAMTVEEKIAHDLRIIGVPPGTKQSVIDNEVQKKLRIINWQIKAGNLEGVGDLKEEAAQIFQAHKNIIEGRRNFLDSLFDAFKRTKASKFAQNLLSDQRGSVPILPEKGDLVKVTGGIGKVLKIEGEMALVNVAGKVEQMAVSKLKPYKNKLEEKAAKIAEENKDKKGIETITLKTKAQGTEYTIKYDYAKQVKYHQDRTTKTTIEDYESQKLKTLAEIKKAGLADATITYEEPKAKAVKPKEPVKAKEAETKSSLIEEAKKYKTAEEFVDASTQADLLDLSNPKAHKIGRIFVESGDGVIQNLIDVNKVEKANIPLYPDAKVPVTTNAEQVVKIYRSAQSTAKNIEPGDYVSFSKDYATSHNRGKLLEMGVPAKDVIWMGQDLNEWIYSPEAIRKKYPGGLKEIWNQAHADKPKITKVDSPTINTDKLEVSKAGEKKINKALEKEKAKIESVVGNPITNEEVIQAAKSAKIVDSAQTRQQTLDQLAEGLRTRQHLAALAKGKNVSKDFLEALVKVKAQASDAGRTLQAHNIEATPELYDTKAKVLGELLDLGHSIDDILEAAKGVDFEDQGQLTEFYRKFVKPKFSQQLDEYVYRNILSSPLTHIKNIFSNAIQLALVNPADKLATGVADMIGSALTGKERQHYISEIPAFFKGASNAFPKAIGGALDALKGKIKIERPELDHLPTLSKWVDYATLGVGKYVPRALEAMDVFFREMIHSGEVEALASKLGHTPSEAEMEKIQKEAASKAAEYIFRKPLDPSNKTGQGHLLSGIDQVTSWVMSGRKIPGFKWFLRFVETPMNIFKSGIQHSPAGVFTLPGTKDKAEAAGKAIVGSMVFAGASFAAAVGNTTWAAPKGTEERQAFDEAGLIPYSVIVGDHAVAFQNLGPLGYPMAMAAALHYFTHDHPDALTDSEMEKIASAMGGIMGFFSDQSYMQGMKDLINAASGEKPKAVTSLLTQLIPLSSLQGWVNNIIDPLQRMAEKKLSINSVVDNIQSKTLGMSQFVPAKLDSDEQPIKKQMRVTNAVSPLKISKINKAKLKEYRELIQEKQQDNLADKESE